MKIIAIAAISDNNVIGRKGELPWHLPKDLKHFSQLTRGHTIIMGRKTHESILARTGKPLPNRTTIIITRQEDFNAPDCIVVHSLKAAFSVAKGAEVFIIGGEEIYRLALPNADLLYITHVHVSVPDGDAFFPKIDESEWKIRTKVAAIPTANEPAYEYVVYERIATNPQER